ncbi:MAG: RagB/SusD family nutrient uptake outer membrane protein [Gemmatimonadaceae bacterium]|nr:RagB/SusD family nutrient uptake outer membrane protein [Gemmatimonadaceae bacterium]
MRIVKSCAAALAAVSLGACSLDLQNPNSPTEVAVTTNPDGIIALGVGLQGRYTTATFNFANIAGLVTDELAAGSSALISISDAEQGQIPAGTGIADATFNSLYTTVRTADDLLAALQAYQRIPVATAGVDVTTYVPRDSALRTVRTLLDSATASLSVAPSAFFTSTVLGPQVSLPNTVNLFRARYARLANDWGAALAASNLVSRTALSQLTFVAPSVNPWVNVIGSTNYVWPRQSLRAALETGDRRAAFFLDTLVRQNGRIGTPLFGWAIFPQTAPQASLPIYYPDEALLIKAEAQVQLNDLTGARASIDSVRTDCSRVGPQACLPAYAGALTAPALLDEIYRQRRAELFGTGQRWEDTRRRSSIVGSVASPATPTGGQRCWLPYALSDRNANGVRNADGTFTSNVPADPVFPEPRAWRVARSSPSPPPASSPAAAPTTRPIRSCRRAPRDASASSTSSPTRPACR